MCTFKAYSNFICKNIVKKCVSIYPLIYPINPFIYLVICPSIYLSIYSYIHFSIHKSIYPLYLCHICLPERDEHGGPALDLEDGLVARLRDAHRLQFAKPEELVDVERIFNIITRILG